MSPAKAILAGAGLIAASILFVNTIRPAEAQYGGGMFQLMHHSNPSANSSVFRLNVATGEVSYCWIPDANGSKVVCTQPAK